jgi:hypothetical protein
VVFQTTAERGRSSSRGWRFISFSRGLQNREGLWVAGRTPASKTPCGCASRWGRRCSPPCCCWRAKLAACVAARVAYGPGFIEQGYVAADWRTAKLMISLFWGQVVAMSAVAAAMGGPATEKESH